MKTRRTLLFVELLEERCTPTVWGNPWPDPGHLTLSFAPDGTQVGGQASNLFQTMSALGPTSTWETTILRALQTWAVQANINIGVVADQGLPFGTSGAIQGDPRFGDIRIGAYPMANTAEAFSSPFALEAGTWSGDMRLNSNSSFSLNGPSQGYDLFTVALHEAGHVFGLPDETSDPTSVMYQDYLGPRTGLSPADIAALQAIYGPRSPSTINNGQISTATRLNPLTNWDGSLGMTVGGDINRLQQRDFYSFNTALDLGGVDVTVQTGGLSLLTPSVTVYNSAGMAVATAATTDPLQGGVTIHLSNVQPLSTYYLAVSSGQQNVFGIGSYQLTVDELPLVNALTGFLTGTLTQTVRSFTTLLTNTLPLNGSFATALPLSPESSSGTASLDFAYRAALTSTSAADYFRIQAPAAGSGSTGILTALVSGLDTNGLVPRIRVFDSHQNPLAGQVVVNDGPSYTIQIPKAAPGTTYFVEVLAANPKGSNATGNYLMGVDFSQPAVALQTLAAGTLNGSQQAQQTLNLTQGQMFHFVLSCNPVNPGSTASVAIEDTNGAAVFTLTASSAEPVTGNVILQPGSYRLLFTVAAGSGAPPSSLNYLLLAATLQDPIGPEPSDPTTAPSGPSSGTGSYSGSGSYTYNGGSTSNVPPQDPSSDPYGTSTSSYPSGSGSTSTGS